MMRLIVMLALLAVQPWMAAAADKPEPAKPQAEAAGEEEALPDAFRHMVKAPELDIANIRDPFASYLVLLEQRGRQALAERQSRLAKRMREPLEEFDLSTLKLVAIFKKGKDRVAMIQDSTGKGYIVRRGNYMGKNNGRIEKITDDTVYLVEQVLNPAGEITDRQVTLTLREVNE